MNRTKSKSTYPTENKENKENKEDKEDKEDSRKLVTNFLIK